jgi:hypothetical protein
MRKGFAVAVLLTVVAMPMAFAGVGFCRSMQCCPPHLAAHVTSVHRPDCCNTSSCDQPPAAVSEYTTAKQIHKQPVLVPPLSVAIVPTVLTMRRPLATVEASTPLPPMVLQRRIAILSSFLI